MSISYNGTNIENVIYNSTKCKQVIYNDITVWKAHNDLKVTYIDGQTRMYNNSKTIKVDTSHYYLFVGTAVQSNRTGTMPTTNISNISTKIIDKSIDNNSARFRVIICKFATTSTVMSSSADSQDSAGQLYRIENTELPLGTEATFGTSFSAVYNSLLIGMSMSYDSDQPALNYGGNSSTLSNTNIGTQWNTTGFYRVTVVSTQYQDASLTCTCSTSGTSSGTYPVAKAGFFKINFIE